MRYGKLSLCRIIVVSAAAMFLHACVMQQDRSGDPRATDTATSRFDGLRTMHSLVVNPIEIAPTALISKESTETLQSDLITQLQSVAGVEVVEDRTQSHDGIFTLSINDYHERAVDGTGNSARIGARASIVTSTGREVWTSSFGFSDIPLSENILARRDSLVSSGASLQQAAVEALVADLAQARNTSFLRKN